jgi:hypothetical protein
MSLAAAFLLAAVSAPAQPAPADESQGGHGAEVASAQVSVTIMRPAVLKGGALTSAGRADAPHSQRRVEGGRITYAFE